jgi:hemoglobin
MQAADDVNLPEDSEFRAALRTYMEWATQDVLSYSPAGSKVPDNMAVPKWSWDGLA